MIALGVVFGCLLLVGVVSLLSMIPNVTPRTQPALDYLPLVIEGEFRVVGNANPLMEYTTDD